MTAYWMLVTAVALLSLERIAYVAISRRPEAWRRACNRHPLAALGDPVSAVARLFTLFKLLQIGVFATWFVVFSHSWLPLPTAPLPTLVAGVGLLLVGQALNAAVFRRLGRTAVFFGGELGHPVPRVTAFPFSLLPHPQYLGAVLSIWGLFLAMRFPHSDWWWLPAIETLLYGVGARYEA